jgi:putative chitinase
MEIKRGSIGADVKKIQEKLGLTPDGSYGPITERSVKKFQEENNLVITGVVNMDTWNSMFNTIIEQHIINPTPRVKIRNLIGIVPEKVLMELPKTIEMFNIVNELRVSHFLSQCAHESGNFKFTVENLNYSQRGLEKIFPKYFPDGMAKEYANNPIKIGSRVYGNRMGNGGEDTQEGFKFRGRGYLQLTGKNNYKSFGSEIEVDLIENPDYVATEYPLLSAAWFFKVNNLLKICDKGSHINIIKEVTKIVNGGYNGINDRINKFNTIYQALSQ